MSRLPRDTERLAGSLIAARGVSPEEAVKLALEAAFAKPTRDVPVRSASKRDEFIRWLEEISRRAAFLPVRSATRNKISGYDKGDVPSLDRCRS